MADVTITSFAELFSFANGDYGRGTSSEQISVELATDLDFSEIEETSPYAEFRENWGGCTGTWYIDFNGGKHSISNISFFGSGSWAFFANLGAGSKVSNLYLPNISINSSSTATSIGITSTATAVTIYNCRVTGNITGRTAYGIASLGSINALVKNCYFIGNLYATASSNPTVSGLTQSPVVNSFFHGTIGANLSAITNGLALITQSTAMNSFFSGAINIENAVPNTIQCAGTSRFCYAAVTNIADIFASGWRNSTSSPWGSSSVSCIYSTILDDDPESHTYNQPKPWNDGEIQQYTAEEDGVTVVKYLTSPYAEIDLHNQNVFTKRGFAM